MGGGVGLMGGGARSFGRALGGRGGGKRVLFLIGISGVRGARGRAAQLGLGDFFLFFGGFGGLTVLVIEFFWGG